ncbi:peptidase M50 [candidate division WOR_3 bacterium SM23_42]|uniref:Zinc metalloprotease n=1 Tax=candidate division WOR_3 bacterium SM23_42 TaxID=1703779 RepID=A0A0S8FRY3_UNCW3|nr:MAG: peptidase M50 [candidate division WOR_3 bacterium SM23_42]
MFGKSIRLFSLFGFDVKIDISWLILAFLITWSLAQGLFPYYFKGLTSTTYWWMGIFGALGLFFSIIFHELSHSLVARNFGLPIKGITLFIFGGVAHMEEEPSSAKAEFLMAIAGPASSVVLGIIFFILRSIGTIGGWPLAVNGVIGYLAIINWILAGFNLLPAFPLDGGRVLRSILWKWKQNISWATRVSSRVGTVFGFLLIAMGVIQFFSGNLIGGIWWFMIGLFLQNAARMSYQQLVTRRALEGETVRSLMITDPVTVPPTATIKELVEDYVYKHHYKMFPIVEGEILAGCITTRQLRQVPKAEWSTKTVGEVANACSTDNTIDPATDVIKVLSQMNRTGNSRLMVVEGNKLAGIIALKDIMNFLSIKLDLDQYEK